MTAAATKPPAIAPIAGLNSSQQSIAETIIAEGKRLGQTPKQIYTAITVAITESGLQNYANSNSAASLALPHDAVGSDHGSVGVFQQQSGQVPGSTANWGPIAALQNVKESADKFYQALDAKANPNDSVQMMAQETQGSAYADGSNYAASESRATTIFNGLYGKTVSGATYLSGTAGSGGPTSATNMGSFSATPAGFDPNPLNWPGELASGAISGTVGQVQALFGDLIPTIVHIVENYALIMFGLVLFIVALLMLAHSADDSSNSATPVAAQPAQKEATSAEKGEGAGAGGDAELAAA